jgi:hypothetical protein
MGKENGTGKRGFKFEMSWTLDEEYQKVVEEAWHGIPNDDIRLKLTQCRTILTNWSRGKFGNKVLLSNRKRENWRCYKEVKALKIVML